MLNRIMMVAMGAAALGAATLSHPAAAADYYDGGQRPPAFHGADEGESDGDRAYWAHGQDPRPVPRRYGGGYRSFPGPVVFDHRDLDRRYGGPGYGHGGPAYGYGGPAYGHGGPDYGDRGPVVVERPAYDDGGPAFAPRFERPEGAAYGSPYRPASVYRTARDAGFDERAGVPDVGCTVEEARSTTPAGWRKVVTHRTCYRR